MLETFYTFSTDSTLLPPPQNIDPFLVQTSVGESIQERKGRATLVYVVWLQRNQQIKWITASYGQKLADG